MPQWVSLQKQGRTFCPRNPTRLGGNNARGPHAGAYDAPVRSLVRGSRHRAHHGPGPGKEGGALPQVRSSRAGLLAVRSPFSPARS